MNERVPAGLSSREDVRHLLGVRGDLTATPSVLVEGPAEDVGDGLTLRRLVLGTDGRDPLPCLLMAPAATGPWPAVVALHQHYAQFDLGKSEPAGLCGDPALAYGRASARRGAAVLMPDLTGFEERRSGGPDDTRAHRMLAFRLLVEGTTLQARHVEDVATCVSWLEGSGTALPGVGLIGHSLGGQVAFFAAACDERVRAVVISCGLGTVSSFHREDIEHNPAWYVPGLAAVGDSPAVASVAHGQSFWVSGGNRDPLFPVDGLRQTVAALPRGVGALRVFDGGHGWPPDLLTESVDWLVAALRGRVP